MPKIPSTGIMRVLLIAAIALAAVAQALPMATIDSSGNLGIVNYGLKADFTYHMVTYEVQVGIGGGGIIGGIGGGAASNVDRDISDERYYVQGVEGFQGDIGMVLNSFPEKTYRLTAHAEDRTEKTVVLVSSSVERTPWWVVGVAEKFTLEVKLNGTEDPLFHWVEVTHAEIQLWKDWEERSGSGGSSDVTFDYTTGPDVLWEWDGSRNIGDATQGTRFVQDITLDENYDQVGIVGVADILVHYTDGNVSDDPVKPFRSDSHPNTINIYPIDQATAARMAGFVIAGPVSIAGLGLAAVAVVLSFTGRKKAFIWTSGTAGALQLASPLLFYGGLSAMGGLIEFVGEEIVYQPWLALPAASGAMLLLVSVLSWTGGRGKKAAAAGGGGKMTFTVKGGEGRKEEGGGKKEEGEATKEETGGKKEEVPGKKGKVAKGAGKGNSPKEKGHAKKEGDETESGDGGDDGGGGEKVTFKMK